MRLEKNLSCALAVAFLLAACAYMPGADQKDARVQKSMQTLKSMTARLGEPKVVGQDAVGGKDAPALYFGSTKMNNNFEVVDAIGKEDLLANVRRVSAYLRATCKVGPVVDFQGLGFLQGLRLDRPAKDVQKALLAKDILAGTAGDPAILRLLPAFVLQEEHIDRLRVALLDLA